MSYCSRHDPAAVAMTPHTALLQLHDALLPLKAVAPANVASIQRSVGGIRKAEQSLHQICSRHLGLQKDVDRVGLQLSEVDAATRVRRVCTVTTNRKPRRLGVEGGWGTDETRG